MANDPTQDPDFLKASPEDQHSYLMSADPDYAKASPSDQNAYLNSFSKTNQTLGQVPDVNQQAKQQNVIKPIPSDLKAAEDKFSQGSALQQSVKQAQGGNYSGAAHTALSAAGGALAAPAAVVAGPIPSITGALGGAAGGLGGRSIATHLGANPSQVDLAGDVGGLVTGGITAGLGSKISAPDEGYTSLGRGMLHDAAKKYVGPRLADAVLPPENPVITAREMAMRNLMRKATREELQRPSITAPSTAPRTPGITEPDVYHWQEGAEPQTRGSQAWSKQRVQSPELQRAAEGGDPDAQTVMMRLGKKGIIIPKPSVGSK